MIDAVGAPRVTLLQSVAGTGGLAEQAKLSQSRDSVLLFGIVAARWLLALQRPQFLPFFLHQAHPSPNRACAALYLCWSLLVCTQPKKLKAAFPHCEVQNRSLSNFFMNRSEVSFARSRACSSAAEPNQFL